MLRQIMTATYEVAHLFSSLFPEHGALVRIGPFWAYDSLSYCTSPRRKSIFSSRRFKWFYGNLIYIDAWGKQHLTQHLVRTSIETHLNLLEENILFCLGDVQCDNESFAQNDPMQTMATCTRNIEKNKNKRYQRVPFSDVSHNLPARLLPWPLYIFSLRSFQIFRIYVSPSVRELMTGRKRFEYGYYFEVRNPTELHQLYDTTSIIRIYRRSCSLFQP